MTQQPHELAGPVERSARAAATRLADTYGPGLVSSVEAALYAAGATRRPDRYLDPISLAALIVSAASLAWTVYNDQRKHTVLPSREVVERRVRVELPENVDISPEDRARVIATVTEELVRQTDEL
jgi:hypothetical protein